MHCEHTTLVPSVVALPGTVVALKYRPAPQLASAAAMIVSVKDVHSAVTYTLLLAGWEHATQADVLVLKNWDAPHRLAK